MDRSLPPLFKQGTSAVAKLVLCLLLAVVLLLLDARMRALDSIRAVISTAIYPLERAAEMPRDAIRGALSYLGSLDGMKAENQQLRVRAAELSQQVMRNAKLNEENLRLRKLLELQEPQTSKLVAAEVQYEANAPYAHKIVINRGTQHGLRQGLPVIDDRGVIGQITRIFPLQAEVTLLTDKDLSIPVQVLRTGLRAIASGASTLGFLELRFTAAGADIEVGDVLSTSGLDGIYPAGLPVATIAQIEHKAGTPFARVLCLPIAGLNQYRHVMVLEYDAALQPRPPEPEEPEIRDRKGRRGRGAGPGPQGSGLGGRQP